MNVFCIDISMLCHLNNFKFYIVQLCMFMWGEFEEIILNIGSGPNRGGVCGDD